MSLAATGQDVKAVLAKCIATYANVTSYSATVSSTSVNFGKKAETNLVIKYSGSMAYFHRHTVSDKVSIDVELFDDGKVIYHLRNSKNYRKLPHMSKKNVPLPLSVIPIFNGIRSTVKVGSWTRLNGKKAVVIETTNNQGKLQLVIETKTYRILQLRIASPISSSTQTIRDEVLNGKIPASTFIFHPAKGAVELKGKPKP